MLQWWKVAYENALGWGKYGLGKAESKHIRIVEVLECGKDAFEKTLGWRRNDLEC